VPVEAVYSVIEVKQTLTEDSLDEAMKKLVMYKGLERDRSEYGRIVENHNLKSLDKANASLNYRFDAVLGVDCAEGTEMELVNRFFDVNSGLDPSHQVNALAILGSGYARYFNRTPDDKLREHYYPESDMEYLNGYPAGELVHIYSRSGQDSLFHLYSDLLSHLTLTVLNFDSERERYASDLRNSTDLFEIKQR
jgi:hypothetical protein